MSRTIPIVSNPPSGAVKPRTAIKIKAMAAPMPPIDIALNFHMYNSSLPFCQYLFPLEGGSGNKKEQHIDHQ